MDLFDVSIEAARRGRRIERGRRLGVTLPGYRLACAEAAGLRRKRHVAMADRLMKRADAQAWAEIRERRGMARVAMHARRIGEALERVRRQEMIDV